MSFKDGFISVGVSREGRMFRVIPAVDIHVGARVCAARTLLRIERHQLAASVGVTEAQIAQYESRLVRFAAEHLLAVARRLNVRPSMFFDGFSAAGIRFPLSVLAFPAGKVESCNDNGKAGVSG